VESWSNHTLNAHPPESRLDPRAKINMNETFLTSEINIDSSTDTEENVPTWTPEQETNSVTSAPRKVARNSSYVIRRDSTNNNSGNVAPQTPDMNTTYSRHAADEDYSSSRSGSNNSLHNISMEELHNIARRQEQCEFDADIL